MTAQVFRCTHTWSNDCLPLAIHTIPLIHVGSDAYHDWINEIIDDFYQVLVEGVRAPRCREIGSYRRIAGVLGLVAQIDDLHIPTDIRSQNIDMDGDSFAAMYRKLPIGEKLKWRGIGLVAGGASTTSHRRLEEAVRAETRRGDPRGAPRLGGRAAAADSPFNFRYRSRPPGRPPTVVP